MKHRAPIATPDLHRAETAGNWTISFRTQRRTNRVVVWRWTTGWTTAFLSQGYFLLGIT
jgi:hypothetical protein